MGLGLIYLAVLNAALALVGGTCSQGDASRLLGGVLSLVLYLFGFAAVLSAPPSRWSWGLLVLVLPIVGYESWMSVRLLVEGDRAGGAACSVIQEPGNLPDGRETVLGGLWMGMTLLAWGGVFAVGYRTLRRRGLAEAQSPKVRAPR